MFVYVKHGEGEQFLVNTCCSIATILHYLRWKLGLSAAESVDLCDEQGMLKLLFLAALQDSASHVLIPHSSYIACTVNRSRDGAYISVAALVAIPNPALLKALQTQSDNLETARLRQLQTQEKHKARWRTLYTKATPTLLGKGRAYTGKLSITDEEKQKRPGDKK